METPSGPEIPDKWTSCFIKIEGSDRAMAVGDFFTMNHGLISRGIVGGTGVSLSIRTDAGGKKIYPGEKCQQALRELIEQGVEITFQ